MSDYRVREATRQDLERILGVQHRAFTRVARMFDISSEDLPPLQETMSDLAKLLDSGVRFMVAESDSAGVVGSVRACLREGTVEIGRLVVDDGWQRRGVATALMDLLELSFPFAKRFELFTGAEADVPLALYAKRGYEVFASEHINGVELVWLQKAGPGAVS